MSREDLAVVDVNGERIAFVLPVIDETMPPSVREGIARRRLVATEGRCPCGAVLAMPNRADRRRARRNGQPTHVYIEHEADCPAGTDRILATLTAAGWRP